MSAVIPNQSKSLVAVIIPCFKVKAHILSVIASLDAGCDMIFVVDDACPEGSGDFVARHCDDPRVRMIKHAKNLGVGGAVMSGYSAAMEAGAHVLVKIDGDGQMDAALISDFIRPILRGEADYTKGNRFFDLDELSQMPAVRIVGNAVLSFMAKISTGYWNIFDPTNGFTAISKDAARRLPWQKISQRYFFETDLLFRLGTLRAVVQDIPMSARYGHEISGIKISSVVPEFFGKHIRNTCKRIFYNYYLRGLSVASLELPLGLGMLAFGMGFGLKRWYQSVDLGIAASPGTVMLAALPVLFGVQLLLAFLQHDMSSTPHKPITRRD